VPAFADLARWNALTAREAALLLQWEAPRRVLDQFPAPPHLHDDLIAASTYGKDREALTVFSTLLTEALRIERPVSLVFGEPVTFYLDEAGYPEWQPMIFADDAYRLAVGPGIGLLFDDGSA
jgi:hypothetical protein